MRRSRFSVVSTLLTLVSLGVLSSYLLLAPDSSEPARKAFLRLIDRPHVPLAPSVRQLIPG